MRLTVLNETGSGVHLIAEYDSEEGRITITFFSEKPRLRRGMLHMDYLLSGQALSLGEGWSDETLVRTDLSRLGVKAKVTAANGTDGLILRLKLKNGSHVISHRGFIGIDPDDIDDT